MHYWKTFRYKDDVLDRMWFPPTAMVDWTPISTSLTVDGITHNDFQPPSVVMDTASTAINASVPMTFNWVAPIIQPNIMSTCTLLKSECSKQTNLEYSTFL